MLINHVEYQKMLKICEQNDMFYFVDQTMGDTHYRLFNYRLASYSDWLIDPITFEMRGIMFEVTTNGNFVCVASRPPAKFFNLNENPFTQNLDLHCTGVVSDKLDGSLISTYIFEDGGIKKLGLKSKMSLMSVQADQATQYVYNNHELYQELFELTNNGLTAYCEICGPENRIVVGYADTKLTILGIRNTVTGVEIDSLVYPNLSKWWVPQYFCDDVFKFETTISNMQGIEGYVITLTGGLNVGMRFKRKTSWYLALHHTKDSINSPRRLFACVLEETSDDLRSMFAGDALALATIEAMEQQVEKWHNHLATTVETYYNANKHLERKEYAIKGQAELDGKEFGLAMMKYLGKEVSYKEFMLKNYKLYGIKDDEPTLTTEE